MRGMAIKIDRRDLAEKNGVRPSRTDAPVRTQPRCRSFRIWRMVQWTARLPRRDRLPRDLGSLNRIAARLRFIAPGFSNRAMTLQSSATAAAATAGGFAAVRRAKSWWSGRRAASTLPTPRRTPAASIRRDPAPAGASAPARRSPRCRPSHARGPRCQPSSTQKLLFAFSVSSKWHLRLACSVRKAIVCISLSNKLSNLLYQNFLELLLLLLSSKLPDFLSSSFQSYSLVCC